MKVLVIGSGGREHAMAWKLAGSKKVERVYAAPGNGGTAGEADCENVDLLGRDPAEEEIQEALIRYAIKENIGLTVVGAEAPLAAGIADRFRAAGLAVVGPGAAAARLESSKAYAKEFMEKYGVRAARSLTLHDAAGALEAAAVHFGAKTAAPGVSSAVPEAAPGTTAPAPPPLVIKADGLAAGKGVVIAPDRLTAEETIRAFMEKSALGEAGKTLVLEEFLEGPEVSVLAAVSAVPGKKAVILPFVAARDHKRRFDGDRGPNTGGMGAIAPVPDFGPALQRDFEEAILVPTMRGLEAENFDYRGFIFFGLLIQKGACHLLEYNARLGDPETQAVLPLMSSDFAELCAAIAGIPVSRGIPGQGMEAAALEDFSLTWKPGAVCAPVAVAGGYPGDYRRGDPIAFNEAAFAKTRAILFAAGAVRGAGGPGGSGLRSAGGRVLAVSAYGANGGEAREKAYGALRAVYFEGMDYRRDIGAAGPGDHGNPDNDHG
ncbi:MAG: phosphoribosylamine--glycine ligase [Treponema sp.]|jgi:phosphoribosylamine--glycine ligase|nr:phosphoribosylamine--glycine ligase [Treponema sp.]